MRTQPAAELCPAPRTTLQQMCAAHRLSCSGLMAPEDLNTMGFSEDAKVVVGKEAADDDGESVYAWPLAAIAPSQHLSTLLPHTPTGTLNVLLPAVCAADKEVVAGLASAKKGKGLIFGLGGGSQGKRGGGH